MSSTYYVSTLKVSIDEETVLVRIDINPELRDAVYTLTDSTGTMHSWCWNLLDCSPESFADLAFISVIAYLNHIYHETSGTATPSVVHAGLGLDGLDSVIGNVMFANILGAPEGVVLQ